MPSPRQNEDRDEFLGRCMSSDEAIGDFPKEDQRYAFCVSQWEDRKMDTKNISFDLKAADEDGRFKGIASAYGNVDFGMDIVEAGAFAETVKGGKKPKMLWQHNPGEVIGVWEKMTDVDDGLMVEGRLLTDIQRARDAYTLLKAGAIDGLSIGYRVKEYSYDELEDGRTVRRIKQAELPEVSIVTFPMNARATVTDVKQLQSCREVERILRDAGVPGAFAKLVAIHGFEEAKSRLNRDRREGGTDGDRAQLDRLLTEIRGLKEAFHAQG